MANEPARTLQTSLEQGSKPDPKGERKAEAKAHPGVFILTQNAGVAILRGAGQPAPAPPAAQDAAAGLAKDS